MNVLLVSANTLTVPYAVYPLGLDYVAAAISDRHEVQIADMNVLGGMEALGDKLRGFSPDVVGLSLRNVDNTDAADPVGFMRTHRELVQSIREHSDAILVLGGSGFTIFPDAFMEGLRADYGILGEGERMSLLLDALEARRDPAQIPGVVAPGLRKPCPGPWEGGFRRAFCKERPHVEFYLRRGGMLNLQTKRGCGYGCIYCTYPHIEGRRLRLVAPEAVAETALQLQEAGAKYFFVTDSAFNSDVSHNVAVARAFRREGVKIPWGAYFMPIDPPVNYFRLMAESGLTHVEFGTESLSDRVLAAYGKSFRARDVFAAHREAVNAGLHVAHFFLLGGHGETSETLDETLSSLDRIEKSALFFFCGMRIYPNTKLFDIALAQGQTAGGGDFMEPVFYRSPFIGTDEILRRVEEQGRGRARYVIGAGGPGTAAVVERLHRRGHAGPLWEYLAR